MKLTILLLILLVFVSCCVQTSSNILEIAKEECIKLCKNYDKDLSNGPCLSDSNPNWNVNDWVCDVAHSPRQEIDNLPENQCKDFREGRAHHFVEVDLNCNLIKVI
ncbi:MAG: hypothetical protein QXZ20_03095 [Candidatus Aenigmatarchaeota archaeon]